MGKGEGKHILIIVRTKTEEHYQNEAGDIATITNSQDGSSLMILKVGAEEPIRKEYSTRKGAAVALGRLTTGMKYICMTDHLKVEKDGER